MKHLFKLTGCLALAGLFASCQSAQQEANYQIIPMPQEIVTAQGSPFILKSSLKILYPGGNEKMQRNAKFLADYLKTATGKDFAIEAGFRRTGNRDSVTGNFHLVGFRIFVLRA